MKILAVCRGNKGRSAAFRILADHIRGSDKKYEGIRVDSAGIDEGKILEDAKNNETGVSPYMETVFEKQYQGISYEHTRKPVDNTLISEADIVLTFEKGIKDHLYKLFPAHKDKIYSIRGYLTGKRDIDEDVGDPAKIAEGEKYRGRETNRLKAASKMIRECEGLAYNVLDKIVEKPQNKNKDDRTTNQ
ncbi:hypothetical protein COV19_00950 [Candidatus Woesearchaeota archaeon CG10_big_fil_rev_8_21_14_0_10_44_13]|nr:MAG: hypothetical protein COV19_00950 [Candidatus Woesearchaeota archaeon CG10_big_fil_rev_8_21_14_0_10_44_13]